MRDAAKSAGAEEILQRIPNAAKNCPLGSETRGGPAPTAGAGDQEMKLEVAVTTGTFASMKTGLSGVAGATGIVITNGGAAAAMGARDGKVFRKEL